MNKFSLKTLAILLFCILSSWATAFGDEDVDHMNQIFPLTHPVSEESDNLEGLVSSYEIKFVSPELLSNVIANKDPDDQVIKTEPGFSIGVCTPHTLYIRADLNSDDCLIRNRIYNRTKEEIYQHLENIAFGKDNSNLSIRQNDQKYRIWFDCGYTDSDIQTAIDFSHLFNNLSSTVEFDEDTIIKGDLEDNYKEVSYHYFNIRIVTDQYLEKYQEDTYQSVLEDLLMDDKGNLIGILSDDYVILWDGLSVEERKYYIRKSLLWHLGLHGISDKTTESFFASSGNVSSELSDLDMEAIRLMYGGRLQSGMTRDEVKKSLYIISPDNT